MFGGSHEVVVVTLQNNVSRHNERQPGQIYFAHIFLIAYISRVPS